MEMLVLGVGAVLIYIVAAVVYYKHTLADVVPEKLDRGLLAFAPGLFVIRKLADSFGRVSARRQQAESHRGADPEE